MTAAAAVAREGRSVLSNTCFELKLVAVVFGKRGIQGNLSRRRSDLFCEALSASAFMISFFYDVLQVAAS